MIKIWICLLCFGNGLWASSFKDTLARFIRAHVAQNISTSHFDVGLDHWTDAWNNIQIREDDLSLNDLKISSDQRRFTIFIKHGGKSQKYSGKITWLTEIPALSRPMGPGEIIGEDDVLMIPINADKIMNHQIRLKENLIGRSPKSGVLKPGMVLKKSDVRAPLMVKRGSPVTIHYNKGNLRITTIAVAEKDGALGDMIEFAVTGVAKGPRGTGKKIIQAQITGKNSAHLGGIHA